MQDVTGYKITPKGASPLCKIEAGDSPDNIWLAISDISLQKELIVSVELDRDNVKRLMRNLLELV